MYDDIYRIPGIWRVPGAPQDNVCEDFTSLVDFTATILDLASVQADPEADGRSLLPLIHAEEPVEWRQDITAEFHGHHFPYPQRMLRTRTHKLIINPESINELYDLANDQLVRAGPQHALGVGEVMPVELRGDVLAPLDRLLGVDQRQEAATICLGIRLHACKIKDRGGEGDQAGEVLTVDVLRVPVIPQDD